MSDDPPELAPLLAGVGPLLLDFDGPVCRVFAGHPAPGVAARLVSLLHTRNVHVPVDVATSTDPMAVLIWVGGLKRPALTRAVETALCSEELAAVVTADPTPYARETIVAARQAGRLVAVVSNNSEPAITAYLRAQRLWPHVTLVVGRAFAAPDEMKPNPAPILQAAKALGAEPGACVMVGDSVSDVAGAIAADVPVIGFANRAEKVDRLTTAGADVVVTSMRPIAAVLVEQAPE